MDPDEFRNKFDSVAAVLGLSIEDMAIICTATGTAHAEFETPNQVIIGGSREAVAEAIDQAKQRGAAKIIPLDPRRRI